MSAARWVPVASIGDLHEGTPIAVDLDGREIALVRVADETFAFANQCTHGDARLSDGFAMDHCIECPLHQGQFDVRTGQPLCEPVTEPIRVYPVRVVDDTVEVRCDD